MNLGVSNLEQLPWQTQQAFEELIVQIQAWANGSATPIDPLKANASAYDQSSLFNHVNLQFASNAPWALRWLKGPWLADPDGNSTHVAILRPPLWTGNQHNYQPQGIDTAIGLEVESDAARDLTGVHVAARSKRFLLIVNGGNFDITIKHNSTSSAAQNRFGLPLGADLVLKSAEMALMFYSVGSEVWRLTATSSTPFISANAGSGIGQSVTTGVISNARTLTLFSVPYNIIPAPGPGLMVIPERILWRTRMGATAWGGSFGAALVYTTNLGTILLPSTTVIFNAGPINRYAIASLTTSINPMADPYTDAENTAVRILLSGASNPTGGDANNSVSYRLVYSTFATL